ncbi:MAG: hypothetical protein M3396_07415 [Actinomycetota bacterium]|nr:hypothetical protein [Actinomycetota bacterium]
MSKNPFDRALDLLLYAPLGAIAATREALPELIVKGRDHFNSQVTTARMMGQLAVSQGQREADKAVAQATQRLAGLGHLGDARRRCQPPETSEPTSSSDTTGAAPTAAPAPPPPPPPAPGVDPTPPTEPLQSPVSAEELAIPGYDALSAPQVVQRLAGLSSDELDAVRSYETATRHRKTILTRISQLQPSQP